MLCPSLVLPSHLRDPALRKIYHSLQQPVLSDSSYLVSDSLQLQLPDFRITLLRGQLVPVHDSTGALTGLLFEGDAQVRFAPRHEVERRQLHRFTRDTVFAGKASTILWSFVPSSIGSNGTGRIKFILPSSNADLPAALALPWQQLPRAPTKISAQAAALPNLLQKTLLERRGFNLAAYLLSSKYASVSGFIACAFVPAEPRLSFPPLYLYLHEPRAHESIAFFQYLEKGLGHPLYTVCSYPPGDYFAAAPTDPARLTKYNGWVELQPNGRLTADMGVDIFTAGQKFPAIFFQLSPDLTVSRVTSERGDTLNFIQEKKEHGLTVFLPEAIAQLDTIRLLFHYDGKILEKNENGILFLKETVYWVPHLDYLRRAAYKIVFKYPRTMRVLAIGTLVREWQEGDYRLSYYTETFTAKAASFCLGQFDSDTLAVEGLPRLEIHSTSYRSARQRRHVAADIANSLFLFNNLIAPFSGPTLRVVEVPGFTSHGFPGLVTLSWVGFQTHLAGILEAMRSHEVAHQWFGNAVGWASYHDQWLSEAFAEYLGALYIEWGMQEQENFAHLIQAWHDDLLEGGNVGVMLGFQRFGLGKEALKKSEGMAAGPLWLGTRLGQKEPLDYYLQTYMKGAYVLHSLRWLLRDLTTGSDDKFWQFLADFARTYWGADPATSDMKKVAEKHFGGSLDWFFQQWVYDTAIPTYRWQSRITRTDTGSVVEISVQQEEVPPDFRMPIPVAVEYADGVRASQRVWVDRHGGRLSFPARAAAVKRVVFNEGNAVLCRVRAK
ncbi:MAG: M1 family aminopeptidase [candidate division KSB1 bacterium]|nr:M1 family aminopeptidase [candidate division KSB1 bacterium]